MTAPSAETRPADAPAPGTAGGREPVASALEEALRPVLRGGLPVRLRAWDGSVAGPAEGPTVLVHRPDALRRLLWSPGELGAAQAFVTGAVDVDGDLGEALDRGRAAVAERGLTRPSPTDLARTLAALGRIAKDHGALGRPLPPPTTQAVLRGRLHTLVRDRRAISHHYDVSTDFYELVLDPQMAYSCGWYGDDLAADGVLADALDPAAEEAALEKAQRAKLDLVCRAIGLRAGMHLLDVGCGWGSLTLHAAEHVGARVTGVTISAEQQAFVQARVEQRGLGDRVEVRLQDYREVDDGPYDAAASLEMGEHVGQGSYPTYVETLRRNVRPGGRMLIQQMSRRTRPGGGAFIESFIAPDMHMRPLGETVELIEAGGLEVRDVRAMREHYVRTVDGWIARFEENHDAIVHLVGEEMARVWRLYLVGGRQAFRDGRMGVDQILARRPEAR